MTELTWHDIINIAVTILETLNGVDNLKKKIYAQLQWRFDMEIC